MPAKKKTYLATYRIVSVVSVDLGAGSLTEALEAAKQFTGSSLLKADRADYIDDERVTLVGISDSDGYSTNV